LDRLGHRKNTVHLSWYTISTWQSRCFCFCD